MYGVTSALHIQIDTFGREGPVPWIAWSPDLIPLNYFLWNSMKSMVYGTTVTSEDDLIARVYGAIESLTRQLNLLPSCV